MALWVCSGKGGCGTKYAVGLSRCPRCHNTEFYEDGDPMAKITRHGGASDHTVPDAVVETGEPLSEDQAEELRNAVDAEAEPLPFAASVQQVAPEEEGGEESSPGSSSSASTGPQPTTSEPSSKPTLSPAQTTASRYRKGRTGSRSASSTAGDRETGTSTAESE
jgi:hypothetical protein